MIRKIVKADYEVVKELVYQVHELHCSNRPDIYHDGNPLPLEYFNNMLEDENAFNYVYVEDGRICGVVLAEKENARKIPIFKERSSYFIKDIVVDKNYRRRGIAKKLYCFLRDYAIKENVDAIELKVWAFNESAIKFYESIGMSIKNMSFEQILNYDNVKQEK